jgi:hypothetical protein
VLEGKLVRNVARLVKPPEHTPRERDIWSKAEVRKFLAKASAACSGGPVCGGSPCTTPATRSLSVPK